MNDQPPPIDIDSALVQLALQTRENALKKIEIHQQIKGLRSAIAGKKTLIQTLETNIDKLTEEIKLKQNTWTHNTETAKSIRTTNRRLHQYEQSLKEKAESQLNSYSQELEVLEEKYTSCKSTFQSYKEYYCQHPLAQKLLTLQTDKEGIERRIRSYDEEITAKEKELRHLTDISTTSDEIKDSAGQKPLKEPEKQPGPQADQGISSFHIVQTVANAGNIQEERDLQDTHCIAATEETGNQLFSTHQQLNEQTWHNGNHSEEQDQEALPEKIVVEQQSSGGGTEEADDWKTDYMAMETEEAPVREKTEAVSMFTCSSQETNPQSPSATGKTVPSTPTFNFNFSSSLSPVQETSETKSPGFPFSLTSNPSPAVFPGFRFDMGSSQDEDISFGFTESFFSEKKTTDSKDSSCPEFVFNQQEQREDFQFGFISKSPQKDKKDNGFPFSFNF